MSVVVRKTVAADWETLKALRLAALQDAPTAFGVSHAAALADADSRWHARAAGTGPATFFMAFDGDEAVGMVAAVGSDDGRVGLIAMWVHPAWRGSAAASAHVAGRDGAAGVADMLVEAVKAHAGGAAIILEVAPTNHRAVAFYARHGFGFQPHVERLASHPEIEVQRMQHGG